MNDLKKNWLTILVTCFLSLAGMMIVQSFIFKRDDQQVLEKKFNEKASYEYVDKQDGVLRREIESNEKQHSLMIDIIKEMRKENNDNFIEVRKQLYKK